MTITAIASDVILIAIQIGRIVRIRTAIGAGATIAAMDDFASSSATDSGQWGLFCQFFNMNYCIMRIMMMIVLLMVVRRRLRVIMMIIGIYGNGV